MSTYRRATISVIICTYTERRRAVLVAALEALRAQTLPPSQIIVVVDHNPAMLAWLRAAVADIVVVDNPGVAGAAGARNAALPFAHGAVLAFLDDDAVPAPDWLERLTAHFVEQDVVGVGGLSVPRWRSAPPSWFPPEFAWVIGCSYRGMPERVAPVRNLWGVSMALRRHVLLQAGAFNTALGRVAMLPIGCEETELCIRIRQLRPQWTLLHEPRAVVMHDVPPERACWRYFLARCFHEGRSKAVMALLVGRIDGLASERAYAGRTLPRCVLRNIGQLARGRDVAGASGRIAAEVAGLTAAALGYFRGCTMRVALTSALRRE
jgi:cellulose synthase/poly-beta-1,6-N-acetylglucosamine synthase-like glycosyltransferase